MNNYFPHDSNARNSDKLIKVRIKYQAEGYGIYFMILERLREETDYTSIRDYNMIAFDLRVDAGKLKSVIEDFGLFQFTQDGKRFYSESFSRRMLQKDEKSKKAKASAERRWNGMPMQALPDANALPTHAEKYPIQTKEKETNSPSIPPGNGEEEKRKLEKLEKTVSSYACCKDDWQYLQSIERIGEGDSPIWALLDELRQSGGKHTFDGYVMRALKELVSQGRLTVRKQEIDFDTLILPRLERLALSPRDIETIRELSKGQFFKIEVALKDIARGKINAPGKYIISKFK